MRAPTPGVFIPEFAAVPHRVATPLTPGRVLAREEMEARKRALAIVQAAKDEAQALLEAARAESATWRECEARRVREELEAELLTRTVMVVKREQQWVAEAEQRIIELGRLLAERVVGHELSQSGDCWESFARQVLAEARGARKVVLRAGTRAIAVLEERLLELTAQVPFTLILEEDPSLPATTIHLHTDIGQVHASLTDQLERLASRLRQGISE